MLEPSTVDLGSKNLPNPKQINKPVLNSSLQLYSFTAPYTLHFTSELSIQAQKIFKNYLVKYHIVKPVLNFIE